MILSAMNFQICLLLGLLICPHAISKVKQKSKYDSSEIKEKDGKGNLPVKGSHVSLYQTIGNKSQGYCNKYAMQ